MLSAPVSSKVIGGYLENWHKPYTIPKHYTHVYYSFITLDPHPNPDKPHAIQWDGKAIYESMAQADVLKVMETTDPVWDNPYNWQKNSIDQAINTTKDNGQLFIWAIGGWSDLTKTVSDDQVESFVQVCVDLLKIAGDGIDFDWEHLSDDLDSDDQQDQTKTLANILL